MSVVLEDYALIGDTETAALVSRDGSIDWLCLPRFDSASCFAALLGDRENGSWSLRPTGEIKRLSRSYRGDTLILETLFETDEGTVRLIDAMPVRGKAPDVVRIVEGVSGTVTMSMELIVRFDYGRMIPWVRRSGTTLTMTAGPDALALHTPVRTSGKGFTTVADFTVTAGERVPFVLTWYPSHLPPPEPIHPQRAVAYTERWWVAWSSQCTYKGPWRDQVIRSLLTLKALTFAPSGGIVAAPTTSLPEVLGGIRNWDYRYCWLRDATFTLYALMENGYVGEAAAWRDWLLRAIAGRPSQMQIMYGPCGERRLPELELPWLSGYENSAPVRIGNAACEQFQLDVYGEVMDCLYQARRIGVPADGHAWSIEHQLMDFLEGAWREPDEGIWEVRGPRRDFTHSKVMAWVAMDRAVKAVEYFLADGPVDRWKEIRGEIHAEVCEKGFNADLNSFTQYYGSSTLDASLLMMTLVGFLPPSDPRIAGTIAAIENNLVRDGFVQRYDTADDTDDVDGLAGKEGAFLPCTFWLADNLALCGRKDDALALFDRLLAVPNDVGLLSEEYDPSAGRMLGNFPQAFSHVGLVNTAMNLDPQEWKGRPAERRQSTGLTNGTKKSRSAS